MRTLATICKRALRLGAALGRHLPPVEAAIGSVSLVAQTQVGRSWQWRPVAEVALAG